MAVSDSRKALVAAIAQSAQQWALQLTTASLAALAERSQAEVRQMAQALVEAVHCKAASQRNGEPTNALMRSIAADLPDDDTTYARPAGEAPAHEWDGTRLRFEQPDGSWGPWVDLQGPKGRQGATTGGGIATPKVVGGGGAFDDVEVIGGGGAGYAAVTVFGGGGAEQPSSLVINGGRV